MIQDDEYEMLVTTPERIDALGFKPQKEILTNHILPYADELDEESKCFLEQVKANMAKSIMLREMKPACGVWSARLIKYMRIYGLKFSKEDHLAFIKLAYELVLIPDIEPSKVHKFATMFIMLTKKRHLITPEDLTLPWRPLYELGKKLFDKNGTNIGMYRYLTSLEGSYMGMIKCAKPYFDLNATKEMLAEFLPQICPWSSDSHIMGQLTAFLPTSLHPRFAAQGHELWLEQLMTLWDTCYNSHCGISDLMMLFAGLAKRNPGSVDWAPYVPRMFTRFFHALNLPVSYKDMQYSKNHSLDTKFVATWIVWAICPDGVVLKHLQTFLSGVESYLHSANAGRWSFKLRDLLRKLAREFLYRVRREREMKYKKTWENQTPESYQLRDEDITEFVNIVLEPTFQAVYSRSGSLDISVALQNLATMRPAIVIPPLLEKLRISLTSLTEPHRVTAAMTAVAAVARPMLRGAEAGYPEGPTHVIPFLMAVLPGLDPNDLKKTLVTLHFILIFSWMVPYIDCSSAHEFWPDLTEEELLVCEASAQFEDFVLILFDRLFIIIESCVFEQARTETKDTDGVRSKTDVVTESALASAATAVLMQCSPRIFNEALRKFKSFATDSTYETSVSGSMIGVLLRVFARVNPEATLAAFMPKLCQELKELLSADETLREENPPRDLVYRLVLLMNLVKCEGTVVMKYVPDLLPVLDRALKLHSHYAQTRASETLSNVLIALSYLELKEWRSSPYDYGAAPEKWLPIRHWGSGCLLKDSNFKWHIPSAEEAQCCQMLVDRYLKPELQRFKEWLSGERPMSRERRLRGLTIINSTLACTSFLPTPDEPSIILMESQVPATNMPLTTGIRHTVTLDGENLRVMLTRFLMEVQSKMLAEKTDDTRSLLMLIQVWEHVVMTKGQRSGSGLEARLRSYSALERALDGRGGAGGEGAGAARLRMLVADAARLQDEARFDLACDSGITPSVLNALHAFYELSINTYTTIRIQAQSRLYWMLGRYPYSYRALVPKLVELLSVGGEGDEWHARHKGSLFIMLGPRAGPIIAKQDWEVVSTLWPAILKAPLSEKPSILRLEHTFSESLNRHFPTVNTRLTLSDSAVNAAKKLLNDNQLSDAKFIEELSLAVEKEKVASDRREKMYLGLIEELVNIAEAPNVQWRRLELTMQMLTYCPSIQTPYPPRVVNLMLRSLIHDDITVRRIGHKLINLALKQRKRKLKKRLVDPYEVAGIERPAKHVPGYRQDLEWVMYSEGNLPKTDEEWEKPWLRNPIYGFYAWPDKLEVAAPSNEQVFSSDVKVEDLEEGERYILEFFSEDSNVDKLVSFLTVEEKKGKDKFNGNRFAMFKSLFSQFGNVIADKFLAHAKRCASDNQEAPQRFAAEVVAAALRAPRYWSRERALAMYEAAMEVGKLGLTSVTDETLDDWGTCIATGVEKMDPRRGALVLSGILGLCAPAPADADSGPTLDSSFVVSARLYALQGILVALSWRGAPLAADLLKKLEAANFLQHPYQNVRDAVGSSLMTIFDTELVLPGGSAGPAPQLARFLDTIWPRLAPLYDENGDIVIKSVASMMPVACSGREQPAASPEPESRANLVEQMALEVARLYPDGAHPSEEGESRLDGGGVRVQQLAARLGSALRLPGAAPPAAEDHARAVSLLTTAIKTAASMAPPELRATLASQAARLSPDAQSYDPESGEKAEVKVLSEGMQKLAVHLGSSLRLKGDAPVLPQGDPARALSLITTVLRGCTAMIVRGVNSSTETMYKLVRIACSAAARGPPQPHDELPRAADGFLASLALVHHSGQHFDTALQVLEELAEDRSWWARLACLDFAQPLLFYGLPLLCDRPDRADRAERFTLKLMRDPRLEVRQVAAKLLTGLMHCRALRDEPSSVRALARAARSAAPLERHAGVLGLCAYLSSRPYGLGPMIGLVLAELARHTNAPDPIPATIRVALADFKRTHQDDWPKHREQLTEEELDLLADLSSPPSYCA